MLSVIISAVVVLSCMSGVRSELQRFAILPYRCQINGCNNTGTCNQDTGKCACQGFGHYNYQCTQIGVPGTCKEDNNCALEGLPSVLENGQANHCVQFSDPTECMCVEGYLGDDCGEPRLSIDCSFLTDTAPQIQVKITPYNYVTGSYNGKIYISKVFNNAFDFTKDVVSPGMPVRVSDENDVDPQVLSKQVVVDGGEVYTYVYIQHNTNYRSHLDHIIKMTCFQGVRPNAPGSWDITVNDATTSSIKPLESTIDTGDLTQTTMHLMEERSGSYYVISESSSNIDIGDDLSLVLTNDSPFVVQSCTVRSYASGKSVSSGKELKLIANGCVPEDAVPLIRGGGVFHGNGDGSNGAISSKFLFRLDFKAFMFLRTSNKLFFSCVLCQSRCEMVEIPICSNDFTSYEDQLQTAFSVRRRREVADDVIESRHRRAVDGFTSDGMEVSIQVGSKQDRNSPSSTQDSDDLRGCYKSISVLLPLSLLTVLLMVSMVMAFYFCKKLTTGSSPRTNHDDVLKNTPLNRQGFEPTRI